MKIGLFGGFYAGFENLGIRNDQKSGGACDSFLGEGGGRGLAGYANAAKWLNPSLPLRSFPTHPSPGREFKKGFPFAFNHSPLTTHHSQ